MRFHIEILFTFSYVNYVFIYIYVFYFCLWHYLCTTLYLLMEWLKVLLVSLTLPVLLFICLSQLVWPSSSLRNLVVIVPLVTSIITILIKLLQVIWGYISTFVVCQFFCLSVCIFERYAFYTTVVLCQQCLIFLGLVVLVVRGS